MQLAGNVLLVSCIVVGAHSGPTVAPIWTASFIGINPSSPGSTSFSFSFDLHNEKFYFGWAMSELVKFENFFSNSINAWEMTKIGFCAPQDIDWKTALYVYGFGWLSDAVWKSHKRVNGTVCDVWALEKADAYSWSACVTVDGFPLEYTLVANPNEVGSTLAPFLSMTNLTATSLSKIVDQADLQHSPQCKQWPPAACPETLVKPLTIYRMCSTCFDRPADEDTGDFVGLLYGICSAVAGGAFLSGSSHIIEYKMMANASFGPYQMFNYIPNRQRSMGSKGISNLVGKSVANNACSFSQAPKCGQCTDNKEGNWYSFPSSGQCDGSEAVGTNGCTWNVTSYAMKNMTCIAPHIKSSCTTFIDSSKPGSKVDPAAIERAVLDVAKQLNIAMSPEPEGGCPEVPLVHDNSPFIIQI